MEEVQKNQDIKAAKKVVVKRLSVLKKLDPETAKILLQIKERANKKAFGRKVKDVELIALGLTLITPDHLRQLQEATYSERDRLRMVHEDYQKANGKISLDQFGVCGLLACAQHGHACWRNLGIKGC